MKKDTLCPKKKKMEDVACLISILVVLHVLVLIDRTLEGGVISWLAEMILGSVACLISYKTTMWYVNDIYQDEESINNPEENQEPT
jgi:hypothetical protein